MSNYKIIIKVIALAALGAIFSSCGRSVPAPVTNAWLGAQAKSADYIVRKGDTIYSIAWQFGLDYVTLARANQLKPPYPIHPGQHLKMTTVARGAAKPLLPKPTWLWPAKGTITQKYSPFFTGNPGINIAGPVGSTVRAASAGEVVYSGNGVRGYNDLIIIKHNRHYLSAYAYNQQLLVQPGQHVDAGQPIATMGHNDAGAVLLHFEIRYDGHPVDPLLFLR